MPAREVVPASPGREPRKDGLAETFWHGYPKPMNSIAMYAGEWVSMIPEGALLRAQDDGRVVLVHEDERVAWAIERFGGIEGRRILELGPLEGRQTYTLHEGGAAEIVAIEGNTQIFQRFLAALNALGLRRVRPLLGDFVAYLEGPVTQRFDLVFACGVLYHLESPLAVLERLPLFAPRLFLWTHIYESERIAAHPGWQGRFGVLQSLLWHGIEVKGARQRYTDRQRPEFCGGLDEGSLWLERQSLLDVLESLGYRFIDIFDEHDNPNGPAIWIAAELRNR